MAETEKARKSERSKNVIDYRVLNSVGRGSSLRRVEDDLEFPVEDLAGKFDQAAGGAVGKQALVGAGLRPEVNNPSQEVEDEKEKLRRIMVELDERAAKLQQQKELELLRRQVEERQRAVSDLEASLTDIASDRNEGGATGGKRDRKDGARPKDRSEHGEGVSDSCLSKHKKESGGKVNIETLRNMGSLRNKVKKELSKLGLFEIEDDDSDSSECSESDTESEDDERFSIGSKSKSKKGKKKSGIDAKVSDKVKFVQEYPHAHLRFDFASRGISFNKLDLNLFVAGELEIISTCKNKGERSGRLELLKKLMYLLSSYDFPVIRAVYAAVVRDIELGIKTWGDDFQYVEGTVLARYKPKIRGSSYFSYEKNKQHVLQEEGQETLWFCSKYQRNKCLHRTSHTLVVKGKMRLAKHICATCWQVDHKQFEHPECSSACPHSSA